MIVSADHARLLGDLRGIIAALEKRCAHGLVAFTLERKVETVADYRLQVHGRLQ